MALQDTDTLLVRRGSTNYKQTIGNINNIESSDILLVNRNDTDYKITGEKLLKGEFTNDDFFLINRSGTDFKVKGEEILGLFGPPDILDGEIKYVGRDISSSQWQFRCEVADGNAVDINELTPYLNTSWKKSGQNYNQTALENNYSSGWPSLSLADLQTNAPLIYAAASPNIFGVNTLTKSGNFINLRFMTEPQTKIDGVQRTTGEYLGYSDLTAKIYFVKNGQASNTATFTKTVSPDNFWSP